MSEDTNATFNDLYRRINAKDKQILSTEILAQGDLPVVDQGKSQIAGYTNNLAKRFTPPDGGVLWFRVEGRRPLSRQRIRAGSESCA